jgi:hypothetical protein
MTHLKVNGGISGTALSGAWTAPIYRNTGKPNADVSYEGQIIVTSGALAGDETGRSYVWICVHNTSAVDGYEWIQLGLST